MIVRGRRIHFNVATESDRTIHNLLAFGAYTAFLATAAVAALLCLQRLPDKSQASAVRSGLGLALIGMTIAGLMFTPTPRQDAALQAGVVGAHAVGVADGGRGLPLLGWSTEGGDLRVAHFIGLHALQLLPLLAIMLLALSRRYPILRPPLVRRGLVRVAALGYLGLIVVLTWQALRGQSLIHPDGWTMLAVLGIAVLLLTGARLVLRRAPQVRAGSTRADDEVTSLL